MLDPKDQRAIVDAAKRHEARRVLLFGSAAASGVDHEDIDLGVEGLRPDPFFAFYADRMFSVSKPVDVVDLSERSRFSDLVRRDGVPIYG